MGLMKGGKNALFILLLAIIGLKMVLEMLVTAFPYILGLGVMVGTYSLMIGRSRF